MAFLLILSAVALTVPAGAAPLTVGPSGQYKTITEAVNAAQPGDTIQIGPGTYTENVVVAKSLALTALRTDSPPTIRAVDINKDVFTVQGGNVRITGLAITGASNASGVHVAHTSGCAVTGVVAYGNKRAIYLEGATDNEVRNSNLAGNGYGVYCDGASHNTIAGNTMTNEQGTKDALGDGVYLFYSGGNTVTGNNLSANHIFGISLFNSPNTTVSNNEIGSNEQIGVRIRDSDNVTLTYNTISGNGQPGKTLKFPPAATSFGQLGILIASSDTRVYLNNFANQSLPVSDSQNVSWSSPGRLTYVYSGATHEGYMGNYYSDYSGSDANGAGVGGSPSASGDAYPLLKPFQSYEPIGTPTPTPSPVTTVTPSAPNAPPSATVIDMLPGLTAANLLMGMLWYNIATALVATVAIACVVIYPRRKKDN